MSIIEGVGDEVVQFFGILFLICLGVLAWWSTNISEIPHIRTVLIVERRAQNVTTQQPNSLSSRPVTAASTGDGGSCQQSALTVNSNNQNKVLSDNNVVNSNNEEREVNHSNSEGGNDNTFPTNSNDSQSSQTPVGTTESSEPRNIETSDADNIRIRLKYLNDDQKLVEGRRQELLGDFKRRHFRLELSAQRLVRLIFNGQVLQRDEETLAGCGLYDNCVVHCLVSQTEQGSQGRGATRLNTPPPDWNLGGLLYVCLSLALGVAWICRYNYAHLFTLTTTTALVGLTGMFAVSIIGIYMHDQDTQATTN